MFTIDRIVLIAGVLIVFAITSSKFASRLGMPLLVLFIGVGMLAGSEGIGGIDFESYALAHAVGTVALAVILFDGGLGTSYSAFRLVWKPAAALATLGVLVTAGVTGAAATFLLDIPIVEGMLLGAIVGSTDAAAVFSVLRGRGMNLDQRLSRTLEVESGSNDPMAVFLTIGLLEVLLGERDLGFGLLGLFALQMGVGGAIGLAVGKGAELLINRINLGSAGLYPVLAGATGLLAYGLAASLGGSGFLSVYLAGIVIGNSSLVFKRGIFFFHDGMAWLGQIAMFVVLGLLAFPTRLVAAAPDGLLIAAALIFVARPLTVFGLLWPFGFNWRELLFISWAGLKGAVPIILATFPFLFGLPDGGKLFDVVFFVVLVSAVLQGSTLGWVARRLGLLLPPRAEPPVSIELTSLKHVDGDVISYPVPPGSGVAGRFIRDLVLPDGALVVLIARDQRVIPPRGSTRVEEDDHVFVLVRAELRAIIDRLFAGKGAPAIPPEGLSLPGTARLADLVVFYGLRLPTPLPDSDDETLDDVVCHRLGGQPPAVGATVAFDDLTLVVVEVRDGRAKRVLLQRSPSIVVDASPDDAAPGPR